jgi:signal peptidase
VKLKEKKRLNKVAKSIIAAIVDILIVVLILFSVVISISSITARANNGVPDLFGYTPFSVQTDSMKPTFVKGDYIFIEECNTEDLQVGDIITYFTIIDGTRVINTHRIVEICEDNGLIQYRTQGDNKETNPEVDKVMPAPGDVIGKYNGTRIPVLGSVIDYLSTQLGFFLVILLPVLLFTVYQIYKLIAVIMYNQKVDVLNAAETASDEMKEAIIAEYLAKQKKEEVAQGEKDD